MKLLLILISALYLVISYYMIEVYIYFFTNLSYFDLVNPALFNRTIIDKEFVNRYVKIPNSKKYEEKIKSGYENAKKKRIVLSGLARDVELRTPDSIKKLEGIGECFEDYRIVMFENDSDDDSRKLLQEWSDKNDKVILMDCCDEGSCDCKLKMTDSYSTGWAGSKRIEKMRKYREKVLRYVTHHFYDFDYYLIYDFDLQGGIYLDGLITSFEKENWDMVFARGLQSMPKITNNRLILYDSLPYIPTNLSFTHDKSLRYMFRKFDNDLGKKKVGSDFVRCKSGFNGLAIYKMKSIVDKTYTNTNFYCEHIDLNYDMYNKGFKNIFYNPNMILFAGQPGPDRIELLKNPLVVI